LKLQQNQISDDGFRSEIVGLAENSAKRASAEPCAGKNELAGNFSVNAFLVI